MGTYPYGSYMPTRKIFFVSLRSKKFYFYANFEFRAKFFKTIYIQADRAFKDESIGILKS